MDDLQDQRRIVTPALESDGGRAIRSALDGADPLAALDAVARELTRARAHNSAAFARLLVDLTEQGWQVSSDGDGTTFTLSPPGVADRGSARTEIKARVQRGLEKLRAKQLADPAVQAFIRGVEAPRVFAGRRTSILDVIDDGESLASELRRIGSLQQDNHSAELSRVVAPSLEVVAADRVCGVTGLLLTDIWRYFRHTWAIPYRSVPGRTMAFLVRNDARPNRPIMGIGALATPVPQLTLRENWIGWTRSALVERVSRTPEVWVTELQTLRRVLDRALSEIRHDDLVAAPLQLEDVELVRALNAAERLAHEARSAPRDSAESTSREPPVAPGGTTDWARASQDPLYVMKRARLLRDIVLAVRKLAAAPADAMAALELLASDDAFSRAVGVALRELRKAALATQVLDLNVCGAVPPYGALLAGKLLALAPAARELLDAYRGRYAGTASIIASQLAGRPIVRDPEYCLVTTTSLYGASSSQYNRLKVGVTANGRAHQLEWHDVGLTVGTSALFISDDTLSALRAAALEKHGRQRINYRYGEGTSPRMRQVREGLEAIGIEPNAILNHQDSRRLYALEVFPGARDSLVHGSMAQGVAPTFADVCVGWRRRWLSARIRNDDALRRVQNEGPAFIRRRLRDPSNTQLSLLPDESA